MQNFDRHQTAIELIIPQLIDAAESAKKDIDFKHDKNAFLKRDYLYGKIKFWGKVLELSVDDTTSFEDTLSDPEMTSHDPDEAVACLTDDDCKPSGGSLKETVRDISEALYPNYLYRR